MATYEAVMRPALEYASSVWSPIASSTSINKLQIMQNAALRTATGTGCTQDTNIRHLHDETLTPHTRAPTAPRLTIQTENTTSITSPTQTHNILQHPKAKRTQFITTAATQQTFLQTPYSHYNRHKNKLRHIHTSIVSRHLATRGNNKILRTPPPYISSSEERLPRLTRRTLAQLRTSKSPSLKSYLRQTHPSPLCPPLQHQHTRHTSSLQLHPHTHHIVTPGFVDRPRRSDCTAGQMDGEAGWWTTSGNIGLPPPH